MHTHVLFNMPMTREIIVLKVVQTLKSRQKIDFNEMIDILISLPTFPTKKKCAEIIDDYTISGYFNMDGNILSKGKKFEERFKNVL